jgi:hypothetical protein
MVVTAKQRVNTLDSVMLTVRLVLAIVEVRSAACCQGMHSTQLLWHAQRLRLMLELCKLPAC